MNTNPVSYNFSLSEKCRKIFKKQRISTEDAFFLLKEVAWQEVIQMAAEKRNQIVPAHLASYTMFYIINYTNICSVQCSFCGFYRKLQQKESYTLSSQEILTKIEIAIKKGINQIFLQGGVNPDLSLDYYLNLLQLIKKSYPIIHLRAFSPVELDYLASQNHLAINDLLIQLKEAGLDSVPGAGAEILSERARKIIAPAKCSVKKWVEIMRACHQLEIFGSANIVFGSIENDLEIIEHLKIIRDLQDQTQGFTSFIPWIFQQRMPDFYVRHVPPHEYLKMVGICRLFFDNIFHIETSVMTVGKAISQIALHAGADDISSPVFEENVLSSHGIKNEEEACSLIKEAGLFPFQRNFNYQKI